MHALRHPHVVSVYGLVPMSGPGAVAAPDYTSQRRSSGLFGPSQATATASQQSFGLVQEACLGSLPQRLLAARQSDERWTVERFLSLAAQVLHALIYIAPHVVHRDVSLGSIVETAPGTFKLSNFGCALAGDNGAPGAAVHTPIPVRYTAPEGFAGQFDARSDVWSFGVMMWAAVQYSQAQPYELEPEPADAIVRGVPLACPVSCPSWFYEAIIAPALQFRPQDRPTARQLLATVQMAQRRVARPLRLAEVPWAFQQFSGDGSVAVPVSRTAATRE
jgi:serine/threonine protein kinase